ncbi:hypothetical protein Barb4_05454 [Bacteroidales bacterium Barb4]|nr:hypothetical protein Barb4_05454 [Bacteroidales bacterium Barb4]
MSKTLYKNKWVSLKLTPRGFVYGERRNTNSTAALCYKKIKNEYHFLLRYQPLPMIKLADKTQLP